MSKEKTFRTVIRVPESVHACMKERAYDMGLGDERGPGLSKYLIGLHVAEMDRLGAVEVVPEVMTFEGMTPGEQWLFLFAVATRSNGKNRPMAFRMASDSGESAGQRDEAMSAYPSSSSLGYQARYDAALEHVKGVMDAS
jgi:hypothetical protein